MVDVLNINFEPLTFCCVLFVSSILVSVNVIDINVQSANIGVKCVIFVSETFTRYGSNIANVWQQIFMPMTLAFTCEVVHENKIRQYLKLQQKNQWHLFFLDTVYIANLGCGDFRYAWSQLISVCRL